MGGKSSIATLLCLMMVLSSAPFLIPSAVGLDAQTIADLVPQEAAVNPSVKKVAPVADSYVDESQPDVNFGQEGTLYLGSGQMCYLMFELPQLEPNATVSEARLRVYALSGSASGYVDVHYCQDDSWAENGITWSNKPAYNATRADRISPRFWTGWENPWDVTLDLRRSYALGDRSITFVLVSGGAWAHYDSREEGSTGPELTIEYLTAPCYRVSVGSVDEKSRFPNLGSVEIGDTYLSLPGEVLARPGAYPLSYAGDYQFIRWETEGPIEVVSSASESTTVDIRGPGRIRAVGMSAGVSLYSIQEPGVTSNLGYIVLDGMRYFLPNDIPTIKPGQYEISYEGGYEFVRWSVSGDLSVSDPLARTTTVTIRPGNGTIVAVGSANLIEYAYDDGLCESYQYKAEDPGSMWAVRFSPLFSGRLVKARLYIAGSPGGFKIHVMDKNRTDVIVPFLASPSSEGWFDIDLSGHGISVKSGEEFFVGIGWITKNVPEIGYDSADPIDRRSWRQVGSVWESNPYYYDLMIRAVVETIMVESRITCLLSPGSVEYMSRTTVSGLISPSDQETATGTVILQYSSDGVSWLNITSVQCVASDYSYSWTTSMAAGIYQIRAIWLGSESYFGSTSSSQQLQIVKANTVLTCRFSDQTATTGTPIRAEGTVSPAVRYTTVILTFTSPSGFSYNRTALTSGDGSFSVQFTPSEEGTYRVQAYWQGDENHKETRSGTSELRVAAPFPYVVLGAAVVLLVGGVVVVFIILRRRSPRSRRELPPPPSRVHLSNKQGL